MNIYLVERTDKPINITMEILDKSNFSDGDWTMNPDSLIVTLIGKARHSFKEGTCILSSFRNG
jgi:hypothetical protein